MLKIICKSWGIGSAAQIKQFASFFLFLQTGLFYACEIIFKLGLVMTTLSNSVKDFISSPMRLSVLYNYNIVSGILCLAMGIEY